jgi:hypothetical protein
MKRRIFCFWTGANAMSENRRRGLETLTRVSECQVEFVTGDDLAAFVPAADLHPAYPFLNLAHRADFLRCYAMLRHGGGYADIKPCQHSWEPGFAELERNDRLWAVGYSEPNPGVIANMYSSSQQLGERFDRSARAYLHRKWLQLHYRELIGGGAFVFRPATPLCERWWAEMNRRLDRLLPALRANPARLPKERPGDLVDGVPSRYPVPWTHIFGDVFHPLVMRHRRRLSTRLPSPTFSDYE